MGTTIKDFYSGVVLATLLALASCDRGVETPRAEGPSVTTTLPAAQESDDGPGARNASREDGGDDATDASGRIDRASDETPRHEDGAPIWSSNRQNSARENAERLFARNGDDFGAKSVDDYIDKAHAFIADPPKGTLKLTRDNGDRLFYDPKGNTFLVATRDGAPRTMFKPDDGMAYWREQEQRASRDASGGDRG